MKNSAFRKVCGVLVALAAIGTASAQARKVEVWDFGGVQQKDAINHISIADIDAIDLLPAGGRFSDAGEISWGDLTLNFLKNDRMYFDSKKGKSAGSQGYAALDFGDGYFSNGIYYCNGTGGEARRYVLLKNVRAGDTITFYAGTSNTSSKDVHFAHVTLGKDQNIGTDILVLSGEQDEHAPIVQASQATPGRYSYIALANGTYKIFTDAAAGKPVFYRVVRTPAVTVSGNLTSLPRGTANLTFVCRETNQQLPATISGGTYTAHLAPGYTYTAVLTGIKGYGVTGATNLVDVTKTAAGSALAKNLVIDEIKTFKVSGTISGIAGDYDIANLAVVMVPPENSNYQTIACATQKEGSTLTFAGEIEPSVRYTATLSGANDYALTGDVLFENTKAFTKDVQATLKEIYNVTGSFIGDTTTTPSAITFVNTEDGYTYKGSITGNSYAVMLRDGVYDVHAETATAKTTNHIIVKGKKVSKNINLVKTDKTVQPLPLKKDLYVGDKKADYATLTEAIAAVAAMNPKEEKDRITIHIAPGVYRQQLIIETPFITLKNDTPDQEVKLTWYYGIGYQYYSADEKGFYNADLAHDKYKKAGVARWGVATYIKPTATYFRAEGIVFETSFNKYVTDEEIADGVTPDGSLPFTRKIDSDVTAKKATERAAAICTEADFSEFYNCRFIGSQDTLYTGDNTHQYFKRCYIEGETDFIFGGGDVVFENCEINWCGYSEGAVGGYLTAARNPLNNGYLFYNCVVSENQGLQVEPGFFGRPWGQNAKVAYINTVFARKWLLQDEGWTSMSGNAPEKAGFREFGTTAGGEAAKTNARVAGTVLSSAEGYTPEAFLGTWKPVYFADSKDVAKAKVKFSKKPALSTNDDINTPYPGHTITLSYSLGKADAADVSVISWYREKDGKKTLVRSSAGFAAKTYLLTSADQKAKISAEVTPKLRDGRTGSPVTVQLKATVKEGHAAPSSGPIGGIRAEDKVNIFLAGDSTVRDYSEKGMWSSKTNRDEGAWGEYLQAFFNDSIAVQNYANGGRSTRNFINEGSLDKIAAQIGKGDYLFIQFGHNDENLTDPDRGVILGKPNGKGVYPVEVGKKSFTATAFVSKYGNESYTEKSGGTYKWFLTQYINVARKAGATPVLVTPVSRLYYDAEHPGKIRPHHDADGVNDKTDSYVTAVRQLAAEEKVLLIDGFALTKSLYEQAWTSGGNSETEARVLMTKGDSTHNSKVGGFIIAGLFAQQIKKTIPQLAGALTKPAKVTGESSKGETVFTVDSKSTFTCDDAHWTTYAQSLIDSFGGKK